MFGSRQPRTAPIALHPKAGVAGAQPMRGEPEGCPLGTPYFKGLGAEQRDSDAQQVDAVTARKYETTLRAEPEAGRA